MSKFALILWSIVPRKIEKSLIYDSDGRRNRIKFIWLGKTLESFYKE